MAEISEPRGSPSRPGVGCPQVRAGARRGWGRALIAFLLASPRLCRVCFPGSLPHRDVPEDVWPGAPELLPVLLQLLRLRGECGAHQGDSWASHGPPPRASTRWWDGACVGQAAGWGAVAWPDTQVSPGGGSEGQLGGAHRAVGRFWPRRDRPPVARVVSRWARDLGRGSLTWNSVTTLGTMTGPGICGCRTCTQCPALPEQGQLLRAWPEATQQLAGLGVGAMSPWGFAPHGAAAAWPSPGACSWGGWSQLEAGAPEGGAAGAPLPPKGASTFLPGLAGPWPGAVAHGKALSLRLAAWDGPGPCRAPSSWWPGMQSSGLWQDFRVCVPAQHRAVAETWIGFQAHMWGCWPRVLVTRAPQAEE